MAITRDIIRLVKASRDRTVELSNQQIVGIANQWVDAWDELSPQFSDAITLLIADGEGTIPASVVARNQRVTQALQQAQTRLDELAAYTEARVTQDVGTAVLDAANTRYTSLTSQLPAQAPAGLLNQLSPAALDAIVARTTQQIQAGTATLSETSVTAMRGELIKGITIGTNPETVARRILRRTEQGFNGGFHRAARIARTEMLDANRTADYEATQTNQNMVAARIWIATLDGRTCGSCLAQHGTEWPADAWGPEDHVQGRCVFVDRTKTWAELGFTGIDDEPQDDVDDRDEWWDSLTTDTQNQILGTQKAQALRDGQIAWADLSTRVDNPDWRASHIETPTKNLGLVP